tara:strand:- start:787 stop:1665 length:879 start_codon:yes stop_codon:yes gene_type:complete
MFEGSLVALVTPMKEDGSIDFVDLKKLIDWHIKSGTDGLVIAGTTGESSTISIDEHCKLLDVAVSYSNNRVPVLAGAGGNSTSEAIELTNYAKKVGADASLQVVPYYNRPTQEGLFKHFKLIAETVDLPMILYNVPSRTSTDMLNETILSLSNIPGIIGLKDATADISRGIELLRLVPNSFNIYSGDDSSSMALMFCGGKGNISVTANVAPIEMHKLCRDSIARNFKSAIQINNKLIPLHNALFIEPNPIPVKWALHEMGYITRGIRLPLVNLSNQNQDILRNALFESGVLL